MGDRTGIEWADHTFNPWWGCVRVSEACRHCYAEAMASRFSKQALWGPQSARRFFDEAYWQKPLRWERRAEKKGVRGRVFCGSMCDVFEKLPVGDAHGPQMDATRQRLWEVIEQTPHLDWMLLTKRPHTIRNLVPWWYDSRRGPPSNVWLGVTVEHQAAAEERIPHLLDVPVDVRFLSCEPLLGPLDLTRVRWKSTNGHHVDVLRGGTWALPGWGFVNHSDMPGRPGLIGWVIAGGESGPHARPSDPAWFADLRDQCERSEVPFFFKQWGEWQAVTGGTREERHRREVALQRADTRAITLPDNAVLYRLGKKQAGRLLDGREHLEFPHG